MIGRRIGWKALDDDSLKLDDDPVLIEDRQADSLGSLAELDRLAIPDESLRTPHEDALDALDALDGPDDADPVLDLLHSSPAEGATTEQIMAGELAGSKPSGSSRPWTANTGSASPSTLASKSTLS